MMNLKQPVAKVLINSMTNLTGSLRIGLFEDYVTLRKVLSFKEEGINIYGGPATGTHATPATPVASQALFTGFQGSKGCTSPGEQEFQFIALNPACPCDPCDWAYRLTIEKHVKMPGKGNNETNEHRKSYSGVVPVVSCSGTPSVIDDAILVSIESDLITQIAEDLGDKSNNTDLETGTMCPAEARRAYIITELTAGSTGIIITVPGIVATTCALGTDEMIACNTINASAVGGAVMAFATTTDNATNYSICVMSRTSGQLFTIALAGASTAVINERYIALLAKGPKVQFAVQYDLGFATTTKHNLKLLSANTTVGTTTISGILAGAAITTGAANDNVTDATYTTNLHAVIDTANLEASFAASYDSVNGFVYVYAASGVTAFQLTFSATSTTVQSFVFSGTGSWPSLTGADVFKIFWNMKDAGKYSAMTYLDQVNPEDSYCKYVLKVDNSIYAIHGASHKDIYEQEIHVYVLSSLVTTLILDSTNPAVLSLGTTYNQQPDTNVASAAAWAADTSLEDLLTIWAGLATTAW